MAPQKHTTEPVFLDTQKNGSALHGTVTTRTWVDVGQTRSAADERGTRVRLSSSGRNNLDRPVTENKKQNKRGKKKKKRVGSAKKLQHSSKK